MENPFWEQQQELFKLWNENMGKLPGMSAYADMYKNMMPNFTEYWSKFMETIPTPASFMGNFNQLLPGANGFWKNLGNLWPNFTGAATMFPFQLPGMDIYSKIFDMWKGIGDPTTFIKTFQEKYMDLVQDMFRNFVPGSNGWFNQPKELIDTCVSFYQQFMAPWVKLDDGLMQRVLNGEPGALKEFFQQLNERYDESFGKLFNMMGMGINREANADYMQAVNSTIKAMFATGELMTTITETCRSSMNTLVERYQANLAQGKMVSTFRDFYDLWYTVTEDALVKLFNTDEFAQMFGTFAQKWSEYMSRMNKVYERMLSSLPIPTNTDMKALYKTVYDLRKQVRDLTNQLANMATPAK